MDRHNSTGYQCGERSEENRHVTGGLAIVGRDGTRISTLGTLFNLDSSSTELNRTAGIKTQLFNHHSTADGQA